MMDLSYRSTCRLGRGYSVEFAITGGQLSVRWLPDLPPNAVGRHLLPAYREARNEFLASLGIPMLVVEL